jgi:AhpD family alkylhydroperoxidase
MAENYPKIRYEMKQETVALAELIPDGVKGFKALHEATMAEGLLSTKMKELIALGIAVADRCDACIAFHVYEALSSGATPDEIGECLGVAVMMGGGPSLMYAAKAMHAVEQFRNNKPRPIPQDEDLPTTAPD